MGDPQKLINLLFLLPILLNFEKFKIQRKVLHIIYLYCKLHFDVIMFCQLWHHFWLWSITLCENQIISFWCNFIIFSFSAENGDVDHVPEKLELMQSIENQKIDFKYFSNAPAAAMAGQKKVSSLEEIFSGNLNVQGKDFLVSISRIYH